MYFPIYYFLKYIIRDDELGSMQQWKWIDRDKSRKPASEIEF